MILRLRSGSLSPFSASRKRSSALTRITLHAHVLRERLHHLVAFAEAQQAVIDEHAGQLLADRTMQQRADDGRIDAAGQTEQHLVAPDLLAHARDRVRDDVAGLPARLAAADLAHEALEDASGPAACA